MSTAPDFYQISDLSSPIKTMLLEAYDEYIQDANENDRYSEGWYPVCIEEFLNAEFLEYIAEKGYQIVKKENR